MACFYIRFMNRPARIVFEASTKVLHELYPTKEALDANAGMENGMAEKFAQLDELLITLGATVGRS
jgi:hypothetical protein